MLLDAVNSVRFIFLSVAAAVLFVYLIPALRVRYLAYGARSSSISSLSSAEQEKRNAHAQRPQSQSWVISLLDQFATLRVPHSWFISFYALSTSLSIIWLVFLGLFRHRLPELSPYIALERPSTPFHRVLLAMLLLLAQGCRRLTESIIFNRPSSSTMWVGHWLIGLGFYAGMSVAIWIEGVPALVAYRFSALDLRLPVPTLRAFSCLILFTLASGIQYDCHAYLASLKQSGGKEDNAGSRSQETKRGQYQPYRLPTHPAFSATLTPHYFAECIIYASLAVLAAPTGHWLNWTIVCALVFVVTNLGITASGTYEWYSRQYGQNAVKGKWAMIPYVY